MCQWQLAQLTDAVGELAHPHGGHPPRQASTHNSRSQAGQAAGGCQLLPDTLVPVPSLCVYLLTLKCIRFTPYLSAIRESVFFFFKEREIPDLSGLQQITG